MVPGQPFPSGTIVKMGACVPLSALPAEGCKLAGDWRLLHSMPEGDCPFGASRHEIRLIDHLGLEICLMATEDFQLVQSGPAGTCAIALSGQHEVSAASAPYTESWVSRLTFTGDTGTGETLIVVSGGSNCMRKFQTTIDRK